MANGKIRFGKQSGGQLALVIPDGVTNTEVIFPESGELAKTSDINTAGVLLKTIATGTATFTATTNNINLTGIGVGVEIGDVIQISGAEDAKNNSEFTVEVITDANNIIVNQAHSNKGTSKNVATRSGDTGVTIKLLAKWYNALIGLGQGWVNVTSSRAFNITYSCPNRSMSTKITGKSTGVGNYNFNVNLNATGEETYEMNYIGGSELPFGVDFLIPIGTTNYSFNIPGASAIRWLELR